MNLKTYSCLREEKLETNVCATSTFWKNSRINYQSHGFRFKESKSFTVHSFVMIFACNNDYLSLLVMLPTPYTCCKDYPHLKWVLYYFQRQQGEPSSGGPIPPVFGERFERFFEVLVVISKIVSGICGVCTYMYITFSNRITRSTSHFCRSLRSNNFCIVCVPRTTRNT